MGESLLRRPVLLAGLGAVPRAAPAGPSRKPKAEAEQGRAGGCLSPPLAGAAAQGRGARGAGGARRGADGQGRASRAGEEWEGKSVHHV